jgi:hypothetical protein
MSSAMSSARSGDVVFNNPALPPQTNWPLLVGLGLAALVLLVYLTRK